MLEAGVIRVGHNLTQWNERKDPKTRAGKRMVAIADRLIEPLSTWITEHAVPNDAGLLFTRRRGTPVGHSGFRSRWRALLARCGMAADDGDHFHFHALRHFHASWLLQHNVPATDVARTMGHANAAITLGIYSHALLRDDEMRDRINRTAALLPDARVTQTALSA